MNDDLPKRAKLDLLTQLTLQRLLKLSERIERNMITADDREFLRQIGISLPLPVGDFYE